MSSYVSTFSRMSLLKLLPNCQLSSHVDVMSNFEPYTEMSMLYHMQTSKN